MHQPEGFFDTSHFTNAWINKIWSDSEYIEITFATNLPYPAIHNKKLVMTNDSFKLFCKMLQDFQNDNNNEADDIKDKSTQTKQIIKG